jgi:branched-chain amino acid transport system permease protein
MMGFAGQLSLGHALYLGLGAYASAVLFVNFGVPPWIGGLIGAVISTAAGCFIGVLGFRFKVTGTYFALLTIAFAEFTRILFDHFGWVGGSAGLYLPVSNRATEDLLNLRGTPALFYFVILAMTAIVFLFCRLLLTRRIGFFWLAIREDQDAAEALGIPIFRYKLAAVALSSALTAFGGMFYAFYYNNLYPETIFAQSLSIQLILAAAVGGLGTLFGPILGAFLLTGLRETVTVATADVRIDGLEQWVYGFVLLLVILLLPGGIWPWVAARLGLDAAVRRRAARAGGGS